MAKKLKKSLSRGRIRQTSCGVGRNLYKDSKMSVAVCSENRAVRTVLWAGYSCMRRFVLLLLCGRWEWRNFVACIKNTTARHILLTWSGGASESIARPIQDANIIFCERKTLFIGVQTWTQSKICLWKNLVLPNFLRLLAVRQMQQFAALAAQQLPCLQQPL
jgi:hypothetical protein